MRSARFVAVGERLLDAGIAPRHARRAVIELTDHFDDLAAQLESQGRSREDAETEALARLNPQALVAAAIARPELHSWVRRWPLVGCAVFPLGMYVAYVVGTIALILGGVTLLAHNFGVTLAGSPGLQRFTATCMSGVAWAMPIFAAGTFCSIAQARRTPLAWTLIGALIVSLAGATLNAELLLPPHDRPGLQAGFGFSTDALLQPLLRAALTLAIVVPVYCWRRAISLGRAREPSASQLVAMAAVIVLHAAMVVLLKTALVPQIDAQPGDEAMTLIVVPPVKPSRVDVSERAAPAPAAVRSRETMILPPSMPAQSVPRIEERARIDFAHEAELAASRGVAAIELERRRAHGFTPGAQDHEPNVARALPPEFGWSRTAQRVEALPEGGVVFRLSERCVIVVTLLVMPACSVGEIPINGKLFEHMDDAPVLGDWKDDSALSR